MNPAHKFTRYCACVNSCGEMIVEGMFCSNTCNTNTADINYMICGCCPCKTPNSPFRPKCINPYCDNSCEEFTYENSDIISYKIYCRDCFPIEEYMIRVIEQFISCIH